MKALTVLQPWAHAIAHLGKRIENRTWISETMLGQDLAIHAGKAQASARDLLDIQSLGHFVLDEELVRGGVVAVARVGSFVTEELEVTGDQLCWWIGPCGWVLEDVRVLPSPVSCRGAQGLWNLPSDVEEEVLAQLKDQAAA